MEPFTVLNGQFLIVAGTHFIRGDSNGDFTLDIADPTYTLADLFLGGPAPQCRDAADANDDGRLDIADAIATLGFLFNGRAALPPPSSEPGEDPTVDDLACFPRA